jgi:hypothetical protein
MGEIMILTTLEAATAGWLVPALFSLVAFFLYRILQQFDKLNATVLDLNSTMLKIDKDLTGEIITIKAAQLTHTEQIRGLSEIYDRIRVTENHVSVLQVKCEKAMGV